MTIDGSEAFAGLLAASAARPGGVMLCVFLTEPTLPYALVARSAPQRITEPPAPHWDANLAPGCSGLPTGLWSSSESNGRCHHLSKPSRRRVV